MLISYCHNIKVQKLFWSLLTALVLVSGSANASVLNPSFTFDSDAQGWANQAGEPFTTSFTSGAGFSGGGLTISTFEPGVRDSFEIVHPLDPAWPTTPAAFFQKITLDVHLLNGGSLVAAQTGLQIRGNSSDNSKVYLASSFLNLGGGWTRVQLTPSNLSSLPLSHLDPGIDLHFRTSGFVGNDFVMVIDNIVAIPVPEPGTVTLIGLGMLALGLGRPRRDTFTLPPKSFA